MYLVTVDEEWSVFSEWKLQKQSLEPFHDVTCLTCRLTSIVVDMPTALSKVSRNGKDSGTFLVDHSGRWHMGCAHLESLGWWVW